MLVARNAWKSERLEGRSCVSIVFQVVMSLDPTHWVPATFMLHGRPVTSIFVITLPRPVASRIRRVDLDEVLVARARDRVPALVARA